MAGNTGSETHREAANLRRESDRLRGQLSLLSDLGSQITSSLELPSVLQAVTDAAQGTYDDSLVIDGLNVSRWESPAVPPYKV